MPATAPDAFRGVIALELRPGSAPQAPALAAEAAGEAAAQLGRALAALAPGAEALSLALLGAHFDPAEALRPGWPLHRRALELLQRAPGRALGARVVGVGADAQGAVPLPLQADPQFAGGPLRVLPFVLHGEGVAAVAQALEASLLDRGMADAALALALQDGLAAQIEHARLLSLHDLLAIIAMQYRHAGLDALWTLLETALLAPGASALLDAPPEPLARYAEGEVRIALLDPAAWQQRDAPGERDEARLQRGFERFQARQRQYAAVLDAHAVPVQFVHCADGDPACLC
ncbi:hypothetical protein [Thermomonas flagellata]|uniref:hypothetical protein n=1 Tax=Thermomonas flagellata TaxID=2888524 RepID=UPI001F03B65D|nr:hypothetical protein [Thermomonas flagellata]